MRLSPLNARSAFGPSLTFFNNRPVIAFVGAGGQVMLIDAFSGVITPVNLTGPVGSGPIPVITGATPSVTAYGQTADGAPRLIIAWTGPTGIINVAESSVGESPGVGNSFLLGNQASWPSLPSPPAVGPRIVSFATGSFSLDLALYWIDVAGSIHYTIANAPLAADRLWSPVATFGETSIATPGVSTITQNGFVLTGYFSVMAWTGTDQGTASGLAPTPGIGTLNFEGAPVGVTSGPKHVYGNDQDGGPDWSASGPAIVFFPNGGPCVLAYTAVGDNALISMESLPVPLPVVGQENNRKRHSDTSFFAPAICFSDDGELWWAWTGTDGNPGSLNFQNDADMPFTIDG